jgi:putative transposase
MEAILYLLRTGVPWKALPRCLGASSTVHDRFQQWRSAGVFEKAWRRALQLLDRQGDIDWTWQSMDGSMNKAPLGGEATGPNPTDRGKLGVKRSLLVDGKGHPLAVVAAPANTNDMKLVAETLDARMRQSPRGVRTNLCLDRGYDYPATKELVVACRFVPHIRSRGEEVRRRRRGERPRRWPVERTFGWLNRCRRLVIRWEKKLDNHLGFLHLAIARLLFRSVRGL